MQPCVRFEDRQAISSIIKDIGPETDIVVLPVQGAIQLADGQYTHTKQEVHLANSSADQGRNVESCQATPFKVRSHRCWPWPQVTSQ